MLTLSNGAQARARAGNMFLLVKGDRAQIHNIDGQKVRYSEVAPLQVFFKWAEWESCTDDDYRAVVQGQSE